MVLAVVVLADSAELVEEMLYFAWRFEFSFVVVYVDGYEAVVLCS